MWLCNWLLLVLVLQLEGPPEERDRKIGKESAWIHSVDSMRVKFHSHAGKEWGSSAAEKRMSQFLFALKFK